MGLTYSLNKHCNWLSFNLPSITVQTSEGTCVSHIFAIFLQHADIIDYDFKMATGKGNMSGDVTTSWSQLPFVKMANLWLPDMVSVFQFILFTSIANCECKYIFKIKFTVVEVITIWPG